MKSPEQCADLQDVRTGIDTIDRQIVTLLGERLRYVHAAAAFKPTVESIPAPERVAAMMVERRSWAVEVGLPPDFVAGLFAKITDWYIATQTAYWRARRDA
ncbi:isochorismate lyase [Azospirillum lipoferum]|uniref:chorismate mutase n=1 Tax=Azospirillum lipoferum (strain 4B) TaxID=862719 RepID=G7ZCF9_AZOL4|nr:isochorismate lyase [Azospirillum lipoferum]CBS89338.1 Chorismate mutase (Salicylate biosynthesis protein) [Azospirillum lipoferum 4B]